MRSSLHKICTGTVLFIVFFGCTMAAYSQSLLNPYTQPKFVNPLPIPSVIDGTTTNTFTIGISQFNQWLGIVDPVTQQPMITTVWGYNGTYPGPTIVAKKNVPLNFFWHNNLVNHLNQPLRHLLPIDPTVHWSFTELPNWQQYGIPIVTHLHGGHTESASDGLPDAWFTPSFTVKGHGFIKGDLLPYHYSNDQEAATIWYHDHALGITRLNVYAGLAGFYLITDDNEISLQNANKIPRSPYDIGLAIQDKMFTSDGNLYYPSSVEEHHTMPTILPEFFGDFIMVNGMTWPKLKVEPRQYRFRVLNGSDSRFYNLFLSSGQSFFQIGTDNGFLESPVAVDQMLIGPGERKDVVIDFSHPSLRGQTIIMKNNAKTPFPKGAAIDPQTTGRIMTFEVSEPLNTTIPLTSLPPTLRSPIQQLTTNLSPRKLILFEGQDDEGRLKPMLGTVDNGVYDWHDPITENPMLNSTEIWEIYNLTEDAHPIHLHLVTMQLINRQKFKASIPDEETGKPENIRLLGQPHMPPPEEKGWKDTWIMYPGEVTRVIAKFDVEGLYVWHCHILSHEDHEMMRPYYVGDLQNSNIHMTLKAPLTITEDASLKANLWPNPSDGKFAVQIYLDKPSHVIINLFDNLGRNTGKLNKGKLSSGWQQISLDVTGFVNGNYYCEIVINSKRIIKQFSIQK